MEFAGDSKCENDMTAKKWGIKMILGYGINVVFDGGCEYIHANK
jgi:hypothetical protein